MQQLRLIEENKQPSNDWKYKYNDIPKPYNNLKVFSCFACGGGSSIGYKLAGCDVIGDLEIDESLNKIYVDKLKPKYNYCMDIRDFINLQDLPAELYNLDILDGSPPCTTFSMIGKREETWGKKKKFAEGQKNQTLDDLVYKYADVVKKLKPKVCIMENVEGLIFGNAKIYAKNLISKLSSDGYDVRYYRLKAEQMGVPQTRHRVFFIGVRKDLRIRAGILGYLYPR